MKARILAIVTAALFLQVAAYAGPFRTLTAIPGTHTVEIPKGMAVNVTNFIHAQTTPGTQLSVQYDSDASVVVLLATSSNSGNPETQKDLVIAGKDPDGKQRVLKLILGVSANDVAFLTYKLAAN